MSRLRHHLKNAFIPHHGNDFRPHALRRKWLHTYTAVIVAVKVVTVAIISIYASPARVSDISPAAIVSLTNQARQQYKVATVKSNSILTKAAQAKANDMAAKSYFAHVSPAGVTPWYWFKQAGYSYTYAGENLAMDYVSSEDVITAWLNSPSHRSNLLNAKYKDIGVAVTTADINGASSLIVVQMFGAPTPAPATKKVTVPSQVPAPAVAKQQIATTPVKKVLGETVTNEPTPIPPAVPTIVTPAANTLVRTTVPEIIGQAEPGSIVTLYVNGANVATATTAADGTYNLVPTTPLSEGTTSVQVSATARGLTSGLTSPIEVNVDTQPPTVVTEQSFVLPSYLASRGYDVQVKVGGQPTSVAIATTARTVSLHEVQGVFVGAIPVPNADVGGTLSVVTNDRVGNSSTMILADPSIFTTGVVASTGGPLVNAFHLVFFSRTFMLLVLMIFFIMATLNIVVEWRHQHHPTIIHSLLILFLIGTFLVM